MKEKRVLKFDEFMNESKLNESLDKNEKESVDELIIAMNKILPKIKKYWEKNPDDEEGKFNDLADELESNTDDFYPSVLDNFLCLGEPKLKERDFIKDIEDFFKRNTGSYELRPTVDNATHVLNSRINKI